MLEARKQRYIDAMHKLAVDGYVNVVDLILAVPIERRNMPLNDRTITGGGANGYRTPQRPNHNGIDFNAGWAADGYAPFMNYLAHEVEVTRSEFNVSYGNVIDIAAKVPCKVRGIARKARVTFRSAHANTLTAKRGDKLKLWDTFGTVGSTGHSTGPHKHFEVFVDGTRINPHDLEFLAPIFISQDIHIVQSGETYAIVGRRYGVSVNDLRKWNGWPDTQIPVGAQMWLVEPPKDTPDPELPDRPDEPPHPAEPEDHPNLSGTQYYRVRKSWDDANSQVGAFHIFENARRTAEREGLSVFGPDGDKLYPRQKVARTYTVRSNDNLWDIAQKELGNGRRYVEIAELNGIRAPYIINPGQELKLPE